MKKIFYLFLLLLWTGVALAQTSLSGKVTDADTGEELIGANVILSQNGHFVTGASTDFDGNYRLTLESGFYDIKVTFVGTPPQTTENLSIKEGQVTQLDIAMKFPFQVIGGSGCWEYKIPLLRSSETSSGITISDLKIHPLPTKNINEIIATTPGVIFSW